MRRVNSLMVRNFVRDDEAFTFFNLPFARDELTCRRRQSDASNREEREREEAPQSQPTVEPHRSPTLFAEER